MKGIINSNDDYGIDDDYRGGTAVNAGNFETGKQYVINNVGNTNWASIGATTVANGAVFTATGSGSGTGSAYKYDGLYKRLHSILVPNTLHASDSVAYPQYKAWIDGDRNHNFDANYPFNMMIPFSNMTNYFTDPDNALTKLDLWEQPLVWAQVTDVNAVNDVIASISTNTVGYPSVFTAIAHGFSSGTPVLLSGLDGSASSLNGQTLYVKRLDDDTFELHYNSGLTNPVYYNNQAISQISSTSADNLNPVTFNLTAPETFFNGERVLATNFNNDYTDMNGNYYYIDEVDSTHVKLYLDEAKTIPYYKIVNISIDTNIDIEKERSATLTVYIDNAPVIPDGSEITFNNSTGYGQSTLVGNTYYTKDVTGGYFEIYTDSGLTTPLTIGDGIDDSDLDISIVNLIAGEEYAKYSATQQYYPDGTAIYTNLDMYGLPENNTLFLKNIGNNKIEIYDDASLTNKVSDFTNWKFFQKSHIKFDQFNTPYSSPKNPVYATNGVSQFDLTDPDIGAGLFTVEPGTVINTGKYVYQPDGDYYEGITASDIDALDIVPFNDSDFIIIEDTGWTYNGDPLYRFRLKNISGPGSFSFADDFVEYSTPETLNNELALRQYLESIYTFDDRKIFSNVFACETYITGSNVKIGNYIRMVAGSGIEPIVYVYDTIENAMTGEPIADTGSILNPDTYYYKTLGKTANDEYLQDVDLPFTSPTGPISPTPSYFLNDWAWKTGLTVSFDRLYASAREYIVYDDYHATPYACAAQQYEDTLPMNAVMYSLVSGLWTPVGPAVPESNGFKNSLYADLVNGMTVQYPSIGSTSNEGMVIITEIGNTNYFYTNLATGIRYSYNLPYKKFIVFGKEANGYNKTSLGTKIPISDILAGATTTSTYNEKETLSWRYDYDASSSFTDVEWAHCNKDFVQKVNYNNIDNIDFYIMNNNFTTNVTVDTQVNEATAGTLDNEVSLFVPSTTGTATHEAPTIWGVGDISFESGGNTPFQYRNTAGNYVNDVGIKGWWNWDNTFRSFATEPAITTTQTGTGYLSDVSLITPGGDFGVNWLAEGNWVLLELEARPDTYVEPTLSPAELADAFPDTTYWTNTAFDSRKEWPRTKFPTSSKLAMVQPDIATKTVNGTKYVRSGGFTRWQAELTYGPLTRAEFDDFFSFVQEVQGQKHPFLVNMILPNGQNMIFGNTANYNISTTEAILAYGQVNTGDPLILEGFDSFEPNVLEKGTVFTSPSCAANGYANTQIAPGGAANAYGEALLRPAWTMAANATAGDVVQINPTHITVTMADNSFEYTTDINEYFYFTVVFDLDEWK